MSFCSNMAIVTLIALALCAGLSGSADAAFRSAVEVPIEDHPYTAQVDFRSVGAGTWAQSCACSILNSYYVLSAARCFSGITYDRSHRRIRAGATERNNGGEIYYVWTEFNHPSYGRNANDGDISVVRLGRPLVYSDSINRGIIIAQGVYIFGGLPLTHPNWGSTILAGSASPVLMRNDIMTIDNQFCKERYEGLSIPEPVTENMICVGYFTDEAACFGDFGGPIYYRDDDIGDIIVGVGSWGHGCSNASFPAVATAVSSYSDWIVDTAF